MKRNGRSRAVNTQLFYKIVWREGSAQRESTSDSTSRSAGLREERKEKQDQSAAAITIVGSPMVCVPWGGFVCTPSRTPRCTPRFCPKRVKIGNTSASGEPTPKEPCPNGRQYRNFYNTVRIAISRSEIPLSVRASARSKAEPRSYYRNDLTTLFARFRGRKEKQSWYLLEGPGVSRALAGEPQPWPLRFWRKTNGDREQRTE